MKKTALLLSVIFILAAFAGCRAKTNNGGTVVFSEEAHEGGIPMPTSPQSGTGIINPAATTDYSDAVYLGENENLLFFRNGGQIAYVNKESGKVKNLVVTEKSLTSQPRYLAAYSSDCIYYLSNGSVRQYNVNSGLDRELSVDYDPEYVTSPLDDIYARENYVALSYWGGEKVVYRLADGASSAPFTEYEEEGYSLNIEKMNMFSDSIRWLDDYADDKYTYRIYDVATGEVSKFETKKDLRTTYEVKGAIYCMEGGIRLSRIEDGKIKTVYDFSDSWDAEKYKLYILCPDGNNLWISVTEDSVCQRIIRFSLKKAEVTKEYDVSYQEIVLKDPKPWHEVINGRLTVFTNDGDYCYLDTKESKLVVYEKLTELVKIG